MQKFADAYFGEDFKYKFIGFLKFSRPPFFKDAAVNTNVTISEILYF